MSLAFQSCVCRPHGQVLNGKEVLMAAARKRHSSRRKLKGRDAQPAGGPVWDPSAVPARSADGSNEPTLAEKQERTFHATHFSADPRGKAMAGSPPPDPLS